MPHKLDSTSLLRVMAQCLPSYVEITGTPYTEGRHRKVPTRCTLCGRAMVKVETNVLRGKGLGCRCQITRKYDEAGRRLGTRYDAMKQRTTPGTLYAKEYGDRGIRNLFRDREHYVTWVQANLPHPDYIGVEVDRIDTNGHYEPGNLRLVTRRANNTNKRVTRFVQYMGQRVALSHAPHLMRLDHPECPLSIRWIQTLLARGHTPDEVLSMTHSGKGRKRTTSQTPDPDIVSLYRAS